jgi:DNA-binding XRE family transcriptional regulator
MRKPRSDEVRTFYVAVGKKIAEARKRQRVTQDALASDVSLTRTSIVNIERGKQQLLMHTWLQIARALKVSPLDLAPNFIPSEKPAKDAIVQLVPDAGGRAWIRAGLEKLEAQINKNARSGHGN